MDILLLWTFCSKRLKSQTSDISFSIYNYIPFIVAVLEQSAVPRVWRGDQDPSSGRTSMVSALVWAGWSSDPLSEDHRQMLGQWARLVHDNCVSTSWMRRPLMRLTGWPERSPELNPIEHLWDILYWCTHCHYGAPQTPKELTDALIKRSQETIGHVTWNRFTCCSECIRASGGHTFTGESPFILFNRA